MKIVTFSVFLLFVTQVSALAFELVAKQKSSGPGFPTCYAWVVKCNGEKYRIKDCRFKNGDSQLSDQNIYVKYKNGDRRILANMGEKTIKGAKAEYRWVNNITMKKSRDRVDSSMTLQKAAVFVCHE